MNGEDGRDYITEVRNVVDSMTLTGEFVARLVADDIVDKLRANDPELLAGWLDQRAGEILGDYIRSRANSTRSQSRHAQPRQAFAEAAASFATSGDRQALDPFNALYVVNADNLRRRVADMTGPDHVFVANGHADSKRAAAMLEAFHRAVAKKVGDRRTSEVFTSGTYLQMYRSITRSQAA